MDSLGAFQLTLSSPALHIHCCLNAFLAFVFAIESVESRLHYIHMYVSILQLEVHKKTDDTRDTFLQKLMINDGIEALIAIATTIRRDVESRSRQFASMTRLDYAYSGLTGRFKSNLLSYEQESSLNHLKRQAMFLSHLEPYAQVNPMILNINYVNFAKDATCASYAYDASKTRLDYAYSALTGRFERSLASYEEESDVLNRLMGQARDAIQVTSQRRIRKSQKKLWTDELQAKFKNAVQMLGGPNSATAKKIWNVMRDKSLSVLQVQSYLQRYRYKRKQFAEALKLGLP